MSLARHNFLCPVHWMNQNSGRTRNGNPLLSCDAAALSVSKDINASLPLLKSD